MLRNLTRSLAAGFASTAVLLIAGCVAPQLAVRPVSYQVDVRLDPVEHTLEGDALVEVSRLPLGRAAKRRVALDLELHPDLVVDSVDVAGATLRKYKQRQGRVRDDAAIIPTRHRLILEDPSGEIRVTLAYSGRLFQDVSAGEEDGQIHNFAVSAHLGEDGVYLASDGYWYPTVALPENLAAELTLADYQLTTDPVDGFELVAGLERSGESADGRITWQSPFPLEGMVLLGGPLTRWSRQHGDVQLHAVLNPSKGEVAEDILDASAEYLDRYEALLGPYPFSEFTVLEAFFSSGFAFPTCTQIAGSQLSEYRQYRRHGYLDHELLHNWWGNGVFVDPQDGNWCEALSSYMGNYYGHVLEDDEKGARKQRRNQSNFLSSIKPEDDKPLGTFGRDEGAGTGIGYQKGAAVFHMLERKIGEEAMFAGLRLLSSEQMGKFTNWQHLQEAFETVSGEDLQLFFEQWVRGGKAPSLSLVSADWSPGSEQVLVSISQGETDFVIDVPLRLHYGDRSEDVVVTVTESHTEVKVPCESEGLSAIELDPDYHVFRKLKPDESMPTSALTRRAETLLVVVPDGELAAPYQVVIDSYQGAVLGEEDDRKQGHAVIFRKVSEVDPQELTQSDVLIIGGAVRNASVQAFLSRTRCPVRWNGAGFTIEEDDYAGPRHAVFLTVHHPDLADRGVTVYYGNSEDALSNARVLGYYANSLLVFDTPPDTRDDGEDSETGMPRAKVVRRMDFEFHDRIEF